MADVLTPEQRRLNMSRIRGTNTKPEKLLRSALHAEGLRFRLHRKDLPGRPDIVLPKYRAVIFVHGCFWHSHGCKYSVMPKTNREFWSKKLEKNKHRDEKCYSLLQSNGWRVLVVWECTIKNFRSNAQHFVYSIISWLNSDSKFGSM